MKSKRIGILIVIFTVLGSSVAHAQYPKIPKDVQEKAAILMEESRRQSDLAWQKALPIVEAEARAGRPYIPWAARPSDLPQATIPAFPGAEGGGAYSFGGRGGKVITVTNLNDSGPGSLREACEQGGARTVVFNVAGIIRLKTPLIVRAPYITIGDRQLPVMVSAWQVNRSGSTRTT